MHRHWHLISCSNKNYQAESNTWMSFPSSESTAGYVLLNRIFLLPGMSTGCLIESNEKLANSSFMAMIDETHQHSSHCSFTFRPWSIRRRCLELKKDEIEYYNGAVHLRFSISLAFNLKFFASSTMTCVHCKSTFSQAVVSIWPFERKSMTWVCTD